MNWEIKKPNSLSQQEVDSLYALFCGAFQADQAGFEMELLEKSQVLVVSDHTGPKAFSTLTSYYPNPATRLFFSGDTYVHPEARLGHHLPSLWATFVFKEIERFDQQECYWLLLCSGFKTYRILPTFFKEFVPSAQNSVELETKKDHWAKSIFGERYQDGVVRPRWPTPLKQNPTIKRLKTRADEERFFRLNPQYSRGYELACLTRLQSANLKPAGLRLCAHLS